MGASEVGEPTPPIGSQISALAELAPDAPAVTCDGRTLTRAELDATTNRLARAYQELGVGVGDYVTIVLPNSIEFLQATIACWKLGAVPQPLSARLRDAEFEAIRELCPSALVVGRAGCSMTSRSSASASNDARHSCATLMHLRGVPIAVIAAWLGHASAAFTMSVYAHSQDDALKAAASSFTRVVTTRDTETIPGSISKMLSNSTFSVPPLGLEPRLCGF